MNNFKIIATALLSIALTPLFVTTNKAIADSIDYGLKQNNPQQTQFETNKATSTVMIKKLAPVFYLKDEALDGDRPNLENLTMGIASKGEVVTIITKQESMFKVRFDATNKIGWVSQTVLSGW